MQRYSVQASDEEALAKKNRRLQPPRRPPPPAVCGQLWAAVRGGPEDFERIMKKVKFYEWCITRFQCSSDKGGHNFLHIAAETGDWHIIYVLVRFFTTRHPPLPLEVSIPRKRLPVQPDDSGNTPLHIAAIHDHLDFAKALIKYYDQDRITDVLDPESPTKVDGIMIEPMTSFEMDESPRLRFLLDCKNHEGLSALQAGFAAGATTTANWLQNFRKQGSDGIELVAGEETDLWF